ncbi:hypothetical protein [Nucisporomicrobium flavum]|nr:hypothetical protein [Nucisporomicrobium flavum]
MSDKWLHIQHNEVRDRNRQRRLATEREAQRQAVERRDQQGRRK